MTLKTKDNTQDQDFLKQLIKAIEFLVIASPQQLIGVKNSSCLMIYYSQIFADFLGIKQQEIIGRNTYKPLYDNPDIESTILKEDRAVIDERKTLRILKINKVKGKLKPYICVKSPIINPNTNNAVGILLQGFQISILNLNQYILDSYKQLEKQKSKDISTLNLSRREKQVIYFFMAQLTSQEIADTIYNLEGKKVTKSTIDSVFNDQLYNKFNVTSRVALAQKLREYGFDHLIPAEVLNSMSIPLDNIKIL